jgi:hypothetical protein
MCVFVLCNRHRFNGIPGPPLAWRTGVYPYIPPALSSDASLAMPTPNLIGSPSQHRGRPGSRSLGWLLPAVQHDLERGKPTAYGEMSLGDSAHRRHRLDLTTSGGGRRRNEEASEGARTFLITLSRSLHRARARTRALSSHQVHPRDPVEPKSITHNKKDGLNMRTPP